MDLPLEQRADTAAPVELGVTSGYEPGLALGHRAAINLALADSDGVQPTKHEDDGSSDAEVTLTEANIARNRRLLNPIFGATEVPGTVDEIVAGIVSLSPKKINVKTQEKLKMYLRGASYQEIARRFGGEPGSIQARISAIKNGILNSGAEVDATHPHRPGYGPSGEWAASVDRPVPGDEGVDFPVKAHRKGRIGLAAPTYADVTVVASLESHMNHMDSRARSAEEISDVDSVAVFADILELDDRAKTVLAEYLEADFEKPRIPLPVSEIQSVALQLKDLVERTFGSFTHPALGLDQAGRAALAKTLGMQMVNGRKQFSHPIDARDYILVAGKVDYERQEIVRIAYQRLAFAISQIAK